MPDPIALPQALLARFRAVAYERLSRVDAAWSGLTRGQAAPGAEDELFRDIHTLKGDARVVGFTEVAFLSQRLEELLTSARERQFRVHEDVDVVVTMAIQFIGLLLRKRAGTAKAAIDLEGFLAQVDQVKAEWLRPSSAMPEHFDTSGHAMRIEAPVQIPPEARHRLAAVATLVFVEHLRSGGRSRERLRGAWNALVQEIAQLEACPLAPLLRQHAATAEQLARELGKTVEVNISAADLRVGAEVLEALNVAVLHALRNAVDHGIESPDERQRAGKDRTGRIRVTATQEVDSVQVVVADDGRGVSFDRVRRRAVERGMLTPRAASRASEAELLELLFEPAFTTCETVSEVSGRGVGLDAVRAGIGSVRGNVKLTTTAGGGTLLTIRAVQPRARIHVHVFRAPGSNVPLAVDESWTWSIAHDPPGSVLDPLALLELATGAAQPGAKGVQALVLRRGKAERMLAVAGAPESAEAVRICPTSPDSAFEIVDREPGELVLLRPEFLVAQPAIRAAAGDRR